LTENRILNARHVAYQEATIALNTYFKLNAALPIRRNCGIYSSSSLFLYSIVDSAGFHDLKFYRSNRPFYRYYSGYFVGWQTEES